MAMLLNVRNSPDMNGWTSIMQYEQQEGAIYVVQVYTNQRRKIMWSQVKFMKNQTSFMEQRVQVGVHNSKMVTKWWVAD